MPKSVNVEGVGVVRFPDDATDDDILSGLNDIAPATAAPAPRTSSAFVPPPDVQLRDTSPAEQQAINIAMQRVDPRWNPRQAEPSLPALLNEGMVKFNALFEPAPAVNRPPEPPLAPSDAAILENARNRVLLGERLGRVESPFVSGTRESAVRGVEAVRSPAGLGLLAGAAVAPEVALPAIFATTAPAIPDTIERIQRARESGDRAEYYSAVGDLAQEAAVAGSTAFGMLRGRAPVAELPRTRAALAEEPALRNVPPAGEVLPSETPTEPAPTGEPGLPQPAPVTEVPRAVENVPPTALHEPVSAQPVSGEEAVPTAQSGVRVPPPQEALREVPLSAEEQAAARAQLEAEVPAARAEEAPAAQPAEPAPAEAPAPTAPAAPEPAAAEAPVTANNVQAKVDAYKVDRAKQTTALIKDNPRGPNEGLIEYRERLANMLPVKPQDAPFFESVIAASDTLSKALGLDQPLAPTATQHARFQRTKNAGIVAALKEWAQKELARAKAATPAAPTPPAAAQAKAQAEVLGKRAGAIRKTAADAESLPVPGTLSRLVTQAFVRGRDVPEAAVEWPVLEVVRTTVLRGGGESTTWHPHVTLRVNGRHVWRGTAGEFESTKPVEALFGSRPVEVGKTRNSTVYALKPASETPPAPPGPGAASPSEPAPGPALTLLGLTEDKFSLPSLRNLSRDTLRRLANSLGTDATVPAIARRAAERFAEMRAQPPGPVGMGGALAAEMSGTDAPLAGTPAHAVETGPPSERPLGLTDPTSAPFVSLSLEMLGQRSAVPPEYSVDTSLKALAGSSAPRLTAMNRPAGEALVRYASSKIAAPYKAVVFASRVLDTGVNAVKFGAALVEDNLRSIEQNFLRLANEAFERDDQPAADAAYEKALNVRSIVGGKNSPFKSEAEYQDFLADPVTQEAVKRHVQYWQEDIEPQFKMAQSIDPDVELPSRGQQTGARINLKALLEGEELGTRPVTASRGGLTASFKRKSPFAREAKGTGDIYESNYPDIIANTYNRQLEIANQNNMNRVLVDADLARIDKPGARVMFGDKPGVPFPLTRRLLLTGGEAIPAGQNIYVRPEFAREYRTALNVDAPARIPFFTEFSNLFTKSALWGFTDASVHISNLGTALFTRPHSPLLWDTLAKATGRADVPITLVRALIKATADNRSQLASLAEIGAMREPFKGTGVLNPVIKWADRTTRLVLDDAYQGLAKQGLVENTETARREFINQVGQYNKRLQGQFTVWLRDTGVGPFVTAGKTFNALGIRNMLLSPGLKALSPKAAVALRGNALAGWIGFVTLAATINYLTSRNKGGGVMGRAGVPIGNIDLGTEDEQGRPLSLPLGDILGYTRGLRATGARRLLEAKRYGISQNQAIDSALGDVVNANVSPALGPLVRSGFAAATGRPPALNVGRTAPVVGPEQSQFAANVLDALRRANPVVNAAYDVREGKTLPEALRSQAPRFTPQAGMTESKAEALPRIINRARLNEYIDDLARRARRLPLADRAAFIRDEMDKAELSGADRLRVHRQIQGRTRYP